jgi:hypothetical protein
MLKFNYKQIIRERVAAKCERHPRYNPEKDGRNGIKDGCSTCWNLYDLHQARLRLDIAVREFLRRTAPWARPRARRKRRTNADGSQPNTSEVQP